MLDRIGVGQDPVEWRPSRKASNRRLQSGPESKERLTALTARFQNALKKSVEGIIEAGRVLIEAKSELEHGQFAGSRKANLRKAEMLMFLARNEIISKSCHWHDFPP